MEAHTRSSTTGRFDQSSRIHKINTAAYLESARHVLVVYGGYTDAEFDVLGKSQDERSSTDRFQLERICQKSTLRPCIRGEILMGKRKLMERYNSLAVKKRSV